jgi:neutral ceramidase
MPSDFRAGAAAAPVDPPLGLPMIGVVRRGEGATGRIGHLEVTALALEREQTRIVLCGVDTVGIQSPEVDVLRDRIASETGADRAGILLNWNHTHHAPAGGRSIHEVLGGGDDEVRSAVHDYVDSLHAEIVATCRRACEALEPAWASWGQGWVDEAVNRRQRDADGFVRKIGWNPSGLVDCSVPVLRAVRPNGSTLATLVGYGCHTVTTGIGLVSYSPDFPGPMRELIRQVTGGECIYFQGAAGNVMPRTAFDDSGEASVRLGRRIAIEALHALAHGTAWPSRLEPAGFSSATPLDLFRWTPMEPEAPELAAVDELAKFPLLPLPSLEEARAKLSTSENELLEAERRGIPEPELRVMRYHGVNHWRRVVAELESGPRTSAAGSISAVRIGDGAIVTGPGEIFTEIGLAVKERSPADVTLYAGYTNGAVSYMPIAAEYPLGGYEPGYGNKSYGLPTQVSPETERILVETGVRLVRGLFPERAERGPAGWLASGELPRPLEPRRLTRPE